MDIDNDKFSIKCVFIIPVFTKVSSHWRRCLGVWDTVGAIGLPEEIMIPKKTTSLFGFQDQYLGDHIEHAFQALALNEMRADFVRCRGFLCSIQLKHIFSEMQQIQTDGSWEAEESDIKTGVLEVYLSAILCFIINQIFCYQCWFAGERYIFTTWLSRV